MSDYSCRMNAGSMIAWTVAFCFWSGCPATPPEPDSSPCEGNEGNGCETGTEDAGPIIEDAGFYDGGLAIDNFHDGGSSIDSGLVITDAGMHQMDSGIIADAGMLHPISEDAGPEDAGNPAMDSGSPPICPSCWRSTLYPDDWVPGYQDVSGRFLHDFSYAGYGNGADSIPPSLAITLFSVLDYGADETGAADCTSAVQDTIQAAADAGGGVVYFPTGEYRFDDVITVTESNIVLRGDGPSSTRLFFTRHSNMSDQAHIKFRGQLQETGETLLADNGESTSHTVTVDDASDFSMGDEVHIGWIITDEFIAEHNMTGTWQVANGQWRNFFRREITDVDTVSSPHTITLDVPLRYAAKTRDSASIRHADGYVESCGIESMALSNAVNYDSAWTNNRAHVIEMQNVKDCWVWEVESYGTTKGGGDGTYHLQSGGIKIVGSKRVTVAETIMENAQHRGSGGNGYLFEISQSNEILIRDAIARNGRHNFIQNWDFGTTGCVFLRTRSEGGRVLAGSWDPIGTVGYSEFHHSLAMANLIDDSFASDGWSGVNRHDWSTGSGLTVTETVFWRLRGGGTLYSFQAGMGYVIGADDTNVISDLDFFDPFSQRAEGSEPADFVEGTGLGSVLKPVSLYEDQLLRRLQ
jgi:hypothetical protein